MAKTKDELIKEKAIREVKKLEASEDRRVKKIEAEIARVEAEKKKNDPNYQGENYLQVLNKMSEDMKNEIQHLVTRYYLEFNEITPENKHKIEEIEVTKTKDGKTEKSTQKQLTPWKQKEKDFFNNQNENIKKHFFKPKEVPIYNKYICSCCGLPKPLSEFHKSYAYTNISRMDMNSQMYVSYCKTCAQKLFFYYYERLEKDEFLAMERYCCDTNTYWDQDKLIEAKRVMENKNRLMNIVAEYIAAVGRDRVLGKTYWDSPSIQNKINSYTSEENALIGSTEKNKVSDRGTVLNTPLDWEKEVAVVRNKILKILRYDPFEDESEEDKKQMYRNFELMIEEGMEDDFVKLSAALEIVRSFQKIERIRKKELALEKDVKANPKDLETLANLRKKELDLITNFSKDHGFAGRWGLKKSKGAGTLGGCMQDMKESLYQDGLVNYYGIKTCKEMQEASNMSMESIFSQLGLGDNEAYGMIQKQTVRIKDLNRKLEDVTEELRLANIKIEGAKLKEKARREGVLDIELEDTFDGDY